VGREVHWEVDSRSFFEDGDRAGDVRRAERRRISSTSSVGRVAGCLAGGLDFEAVVVGAARSRLLRAVLRSWDLAARTRAVLRAFSFVRKVRKMKKGGVLLSRHPALFVPGGF
jgi:hypothetical protein